MYIEYFEDLFWIADNTYDNHGYYHQDFNISSYLNYSNQNSISLGTDYSFTNDGSISEDGVTVNHMSFGPGLNVTYAGLDEWNYHHHQDISIINNDDSIVVDNYMNVVIDTTANEHGASIQVDDAKRGTITTGNGDDRIDVDVYSDSAEGDNRFTIASGDGDDVIALRHSQHSEYTSIDMNAGKGNDIIDVSDLASSDTFAASRHIDGGEGTDAITISGDNMVSFDNVELVRGTDDASLTITSEMLAHNNSLGGMIFADVALSFDDSILSYDVRDFTEQDCRYMGTGLNHVWGGDHSFDYDAEDYVVVTVQTAEGSYELITNDQNFTDDMVSINKGTVTDSSVHESVTSVEDDDAMYVAADYWNQNSLKTVSVDNDDSVVMVDNIVDVNIHNTNTNAVDIAVNNVKRGEISAENGDANISVGLYSNNASGGNTFDITTDKGCDTIVLTNEQNSQYTSFHIQTGAGYDVVDVSGIEAPASSEVVRVIDGGTSNDEYDSDYHEDVLIFSGEDSMTFKNFEVVKGVDGAALTMTDVLMADNNSEEGLVVADVDLTLDSSILSYQVGEVQFAADTLDYAGLNADDFVELTLTTDDGIYSLVTNDAQFVDQLGDA